MSALGPLGPLVYKHIAKYTLTMACVQYVHMIHLNEHVRLIELETVLVCNIFTGNSQKRWTAYLFIKNMKSSRHAFYANAPLLSQVLCCKHYFSMYLDKYLKEILLFFKRKYDHENPHPLNTKVLKLMYNMVSNNYILFGALIVWFWVRHKIQLSTTGIHYPSHRLSKF